MFWTRNSYVDRTLIALVLVAFAWVPTSANGQQSAADAATLGQKADALIADLRSRGEDLRELRKHLDSADGERRAIYRDELSRRWESFAGKLDELVRNIAAQQAKGIDPGPQLDAAREMSTAVAEGLSEVLLSRNGALRRMEDDRAAASAEEQGALDRQARRESMVYLGLLESMVTHIERMKQLGLDSTAEEELVDHLLNERAGYLEGRLRLLDSQRVEVKELLRGAMDEEKTALQKELRWLNGQVTAAADGLRDVLDQMDRRKLATTDTRQLLINTTRELAPGSLDTKVAVGLLKQWVNDGRGWMRENGSRAVVHLLIALLIMVVFWLLSKFAGRIVGLGVRSARFEISKLLQEFFVAVTARTILMIGVLVALAQLGLNLAPLLAGLGIAGFIVGFALQDSLGNFASGLMILLYRPYDVGDAVEVAGVLGVVSEMSVVSTTIKTFDNQKLIVPNSKIWGNVIRNLTAEATRRVDLVFGISYGDDIAKAERVMKEEVEKHELVLKDPEPVIKVSALADSSVNFVVRPWTKTPDYWTVYWDLTRNIKLRFDAEGITIPFPQRDVHMHKVE